MKIRFSEQALHTVAKAGERVKIEQGEMVRGAWASEELKKAKNLEHINAKMAIWVQTHAQDQAAAQEYQELLLLGMSEYDAYVELARRIERVVNNVTRSHESIEPPSP